MPKIAIGPMTRAITDMSGLWTTMTATRPTTVRRSRPKLVITVCSTARAALALFDMRVMSSLEWCLL